MIKCDKGYGWFELSIVRNGGTDIVGPFRRKMKVGLHEYADYLTFKHKGLKFIFMFYASRESSFFWLTQVEYEHGVKHPAFDRTLGYKDIKTHLIHYKDFNTIFPQILNMSHENEEGQEKAANQ